MDGAARAAAPAGEEVWVENADGHPNVRAYFMGPFADLYNPSRLKDYQVPDVLPDTTLYKDAISFPLFPNVYESITPKQYNERTEHGRHLSGQFWEPSGTDSSDEARKRDASTLKGYKIPPTEIKNMMRQFVILRFGWKEPHSRYESVGGEGYMYVVVPKRHVTFGAEEVQRKATSNPIHMQMKAEQERKMKSEITIAQERIEHYTTNKGTWVREITEAAASEKWSQVMAIARDAQKRFLDFQDSNNKLAEPEYKDFMRTMSKSAAVEPFGAARAGGMGEQKVMQATVVDPRAAKSQAFQGSAPYAAAMAATSVPMGAHGGFEGGMSTRRATRGAGGGRAGGGFSYEEERPIIQQAKVMGFSQGQIDAALEARVDTHQSPFTDIGEFVEFVLAHQ